ncbi:hypothetical protein S40285_00719 [Stachybotrys chlorohalonatus IBT 40285]|uniref:Cell cycle inhibitor Nif1 n=1 Tax=Stachybotrys chlorohalonatus (strain IBT 40285) TaxID=1283841 RepID=A0A084QRC1_STAC4|nr:hypothetical protein S40285_00719 [Stachybotrys chlorohalonata IBT 40285]
MAATRPNLLDLRADSHNSSTSSFSKPLRSPRLHVAGEAPPELSPLDAFALQSRLLARQLQESAKDGSRVSRLPPLTTESPLVVQGRSDYFRSMHQDSDLEADEHPPLEPPSLGMRTEVEDAFDEAQRPMSMHPRMSTIPPTPIEGPSLLSKSARDQSRGRGLADIAEQIDFGARRTRSPSPLYSDTQSQYGRREDVSPVTNEPSFNATSPHKSHLTSSPGKSKQSASYDEGLAPPRYNLPRRSSSSVSSTFDLHGEDASGNLAISVHSLPPRKSSRGSFVQGYPGAPPVLGSSQRSPSVTSDTSPLPRPSYNFSRPLSRAGTPSFDTPSRQASSDSQPSFVFADESAHTPVSMHSEAFMDQPADDGKSAAPSYIYSKFSLPRGKSLQRHGPKEQQSQGPNRLEQPAATPSTSAQRAGMGAPPSPPTRPSSSSGKDMPDDAVSALSSLTRPSTDTNKVSLDSSRLAPTWSRPSNDGSRSSEESPRGRPWTSPLHDGSQSKAPASTDTSDSNSTIRPTTTSRSVAPAAAEMSAEEHLAKGIECHENGSLNESTYHLRYAARQNNPTAMLLYALACRHGWGMRANQKEGVQWLRKAAEYASIEIADDEDQIKDGKHVDAIERRTRKAQFALSVYELGVSHMNGWGIEQDKTLALRCFEIAGNWGDVDALAEAGFCYAQGIGCKKNLKKSAKYYRMAEAKGMSMVGNSWIHKAKYDDDDDDDKDSSKKKNRSKSRTRTIFGLKSLS